MLVKSDDERDIITNDGHVLGDIGRRIRDGGERRTATVSDTGDSRARARTIRDKARARRRQRILDGPDCRPGLIERGIRVAPAANRGIKRSADGIS